MIPTELHPWPPLLALVTAGFRSAFKSATPPRCSASL